jgi:hypothetical protein
MANPSLGQVSPIASTLTAIYTVPPDKVAAELLLVVCNRGTNANSFRIAHALDGAVDDVKQYLYFGQVIQGNETLAISLAFLSLEAGDVLRVWNQGQVSFGLYGRESAVPV